MDSFRYELVRDVRCYLPFKHRVFSLEHWDTQATSSLGQLKKHSTKLISQRSEQAEFKSGTLKSISTRAEIRHAT